MRTSPADLLWPAFQLTSFLFTSFHKASVQMLLTSLRSSCHGSVENNPLVRKGKAVFEDWTFPGRMQEEYISYISESILLRHCKASSAFPSQNYHYMHSWNSLVFWFWLLSVMRLRSPDGFFNLMCQASQTCRTGLGNKFKGGTGGWKGQTSFRLIWIMYVWGNTMTSAENHTWRFNRWLKQLDISNDFWRHFLLHVLKNKHFQKWHCVTSNLKALCNTWGHGSPTSPPVVRGPVSWMQLPTKCWVRFQQPARSVEKKDFRMKIGIFIFFWGELVQRISIVLVVSYTLLMFIINRCIILKYFLIASLAPFQFPTRAKGHSSCRGSREESVLGTWTLWRSFPWDSWLDKENPTNKYLKHLKYYKYSQSFKSSWHSFLITKPICRKSHEKPKKTTNPSSSAFCKAAWSAWPISDCTVKTGPKQLPDENRPLRKGRKHKNVPIFVSSYTVVVIISRVISELLLIIVLWTSLNLALKKPCSQSSHLSSAFARGTGENVPEVASRLDPNIPMFIFWETMICNGKGIIYMDWHVSSTIDGVAGGLKQMLSFLMSYQSFQMRLRLCMYVSETLCLSQVKSQYSQHVVHIHQKLNWLILSFTNDQQMAIHWDASQ